jgi:hypothetical protein
MKIVKYVFPIILLLVVIYGYFWLKGFESNNVEPFNAISENNIVFLETQSLERFFDVLTHNEIWSELKNIESIAKTDSIIKQFIGLNFQDEDIKNIFKGKAVLSINSDAAGKAELVIILKMQRKLKDKILVKELIESGKVKEISKSKFRGNSIHTARFQSTDGLDSMHLGLKKGLLIASTSRYQIENTLKHLEEDNPEPIHKFTRLKSASSPNVFGSFFINFKSVNAFQGLLGPFLQVMFESGGYDLEIGNDQLVLNGFTTTDDSLDQGIRIISGQSPASMRLADYIPASSAFLMQLSFNSIEAFFNSGAEYEMWKSDNKKIIEIEAEYAININLIEEGIGNEFGLVILNTLNKPSHFFVSQLKSGSNTEAQFKQWIELYAAQYNQNQKVFEFNYTIDNQQAIKIYNLPLGGIPALIFGSAFKSVQGDFFSVFENHLIFGNSVEEVGTYIYQLILGRNLSSNEGYKEVSNDILSRSNFFIYLNPYMTLELFSDALKPEAKEFLKEYAKVLRKINRLSIQINPSDDVYYTRLFTHYSESNAAYVNTIWMSRLDTVSAIKPAIVINHLNNEKEIMVQDAKNQLYLISNAGRILWKIPLESPLKSEIYQIDYYRNGKLQYLFNTKEKIYLLDRLGNDVEKYPITLRSPASNALSVFDYENDGNIRICIACENRQIYMYELQGRLLSGWNPSLTDYPVLKPIQHFRVDRKDYLVAADKFKTYILDRQGRVRVDIKKQFPVSMNNPFYLDLSKGVKNARLLSTDVNGNILSIYFSGITVLEATEINNPDHFFVFQDISGDKRQEYVFTIGNTLLVKDYDGKRIFERAFQESIKHKPFIYEFSGKDKKIGIVQETEESVYLLNSDGGIYNGFPLKGSTLFSISNFPGLNAKFNLIVGNKDNFLYNYSVK